MTALKSHALNGMSPLFPQIGWWLDSEWIDAFQGFLSLDHFRRMLDQSQIPYFRWGNCWVINAEDFFTQQGFSMSRTPAPNGIVPRLPQTGWFSDREWAEAFEEEVTTFREKMRKHDVPAMKWGNTYFINAEQFYAAMQAATK